MIISCLEMSVMKLPVEGSECPKTKDKEAKLSIIKGKKILVAWANPKESCLGLHVSWKYFMSHHTPEVHFLTLCAVFACLTDTSYSGSFNYPYTAYNVYSRQWHPVL